MNLRIAPLAVALLLFFAGWAHAITYLIETKHQRLYQLHGFVMSEQISLNDERDHPSNTADVEVNSRTEIKDDLLFDSKGGLLSTNNQIYVMDHLGTIYTAPFITHHSYFLKSKPSDELYGIGLDVACAGDITVRNGKIVAISNNSGHYLPNEDQLKLAVKFLHSKGVVDPEVDISVRHLVGEVKKLQLASIIEEDANSIISKYPLSFKSTNLDYINDLNSKRNSLNLAVDDLRARCPQALLSKPVSSILPSFVIPKTAGRFDLGIIHLDGSDWKMMLENSWDSLPREIIEAPISAFAIQQFSNSTLVQFEKNNGITIQRGACIYSILHNPEPQKAFALYLFPVKI